MNEFFLHYFFQIILLLNNKVSKKKEKEKKSYSESGDRIINSIRHILYICYHKSRHN